MQTLIVRSAQAAASALVRSTVKGRSFLLVVPADLGGTTARAANWIVSLFTRRRKMTGSGEPQIRRGSRVIIVGIVILALATAAICLPMLKTDSAGSNDTGSAAVDAGASVKSTPFKTAGVIGESSNSVPYGANSQTVGILRPDSGEDDSLKKQAHK